MHFLQMSTANAHLADVAILVRDACDARGLGVETQTKHRKTHHDDENDHIMRTCCGNCVDVQYYHANNPMMRCLATNEALPFRSLGNEAPA